MKKHFKLYKAGKLWLTAAITVGALTIGAGMTTIHAATVANSQTTTQVTEPAPVSASANNQQQTKNSTTSAQTPANETSINGYTNHDSVWTNTMGQRADGWQQSGNDWYYFNNGTQTKNWQRVNNSWYYMNPETAVMETGLQSINNATYYLKESNPQQGSMQTGWQRVNNQWYYFQNSGAALTGWYQSQTGNWYYFNQDGHAASGFTRVGNNDYYFDPSQAWMSQGGWNKINNSWYYMDPSHKGQYGAILKGWQTINGHRYYLNPETGMMATGDTVINGQHYSFDAQNGYQQIGFALDETTGLLRYYDPSTGIRRTELTENGQTYHFDVVTGLIDTTNLTNGINKIGDQLFYYDATNHRFYGNGWQRINGSWYYFNTNGSAQTGWFQSPHSKAWYYFDQNARAVTGLQKINGAWYDFDSANAWANTGWQKINGAWYYFNPTNAWAYTGWQKINGAWYYFNTTSAAAETGWQKINGAWYYFDPTNANAWTGWHYINGAWYYFDLTNTWAYTGYHWVNGIEYYFDPTNAYMYRNRWVNVGGWTYHADNSGRLWFPQWYTQFPVNEGCAVVSLAMMLSPKEYFNWSYAFQLLQQRQSGNIYTGAGFRRVIQPGPLVDLAHHFDSSVHDISGSSVQDIINLVQSGHPVEYFGYSRYEQYYLSHNHCKVIVGYQNGWFRVYDPCYYSANQGSTGWNAYDYGAKAWITTAQFAREYAGQAITVD